MRNPSRALLVAMLMASLILPPSVPLAGAAKVDPGARADGNRLMLVGDSLAIGLGQQLAAVLDQRPGLRFTHLGKVSSGLANPAFFDWPSRLTAMVRENHPDVVLMLYGANDNKPLAVNGRSVAFGTPAWNKEYAARLTRMVAIVHGANPRARVFVLGVPVMADATFNTEMTRVNAVLAETAKALPDTTFVPTRDVLADAAGAFAAEGRRADGSMVRLRAKDGVHISSIGSRLLAGRCLEAVSAAGGLPTGGLLASLADRDVRPVSAASAKPAPIRLAEARPTLSDRPAASQPIAPAPTKKPEPVAVKPEPVPAKPEAVAAKPEVAPAPGAYTVADGDTLWAVARRLGLTQAQLLQANPGVDPRRLSIGQSLAVPGSTAQLAAAAATGTPEPAKVVVVAGRNHTVAEGDNFWSVARVYGVSVADLTAVNPGVDPTRLQIGQSLAIPAASRTAVAEASAPAGSGYTVADGDNFWSIAHRLGLDLAAFKQANANVDPLRLRPGQVLALPTGARIADQAESPQRESVAVAAEAGIYPVAAGDTLWSLSRRFGVSLESLLSVNGELDPTRLQVGQLVTIPGRGQPLAAADMLLFPVSSGDTLWGIARRFGVSVADLTAVNPGVDPLHLREGQTLHVPSSLAAVAAPDRKPDQAPSSLPPVVSGDPGRLHSVVTGDTLWRLARRFGVPLETLLRENAGIDPVRMHVGQTVRLPGSVVSMAAR